MLKIQRYLQSGKTLANLQADFGIRARRHVKYNNLVLLKYNQINSPKAEQIVRECRGLILDESDNWAIVSRPLDRFFNTGESCADELDVDSAVAYEKLDGSLMCLYYYDGAWQVQTSGTPDAAGEVNQMGLTFKDLFWETWSYMGYLLPTGVLNQSRTFIFELTGPLNQVVVQYNEAKIRLLAVRNKDSGLEHNLEYMAWLNEWQHAKRFDASRLDMSRPASELEGYVLVDKYFKRVKIKTEQYVAMHRSANGMTNADALAIVMTGELDEVLAYWPKYKDLLLSMQAKWLKLCEDVNLDWLIYKPLAADRAWFAIAIRHLPHKAMLFSLADNRDWIVQAKANPNNVLKLIS